jgi:hypothetical protein
MRPRPLASWFVLWCALLSGVERASAHITPPVVLISDRDAIVGMLGDATKLLVVSLYRVKPLEDIEKISVFLHSSPVIGFPEELEQ